MNLAHCSKNTIDESSRLNQFAWEQLENQSPVAVLFRPGSNGLDRYVVQRYVEHVFAQSIRWNHLSSYFSSIKSSIRTYSLTTYEFELMQSILDFHLSKKVRLRLSKSTDRLIAFEDLMDFIDRAQQLYNTDHSISSNHNVPIQEKKLPPANKTQTPPPPPRVQLITSKASPVHYLTSNKPAETIDRSTSKLSSDRHSNGNSTIPLSSELCLASLSQAKIDGNGWIQINNVYLPFILKHRQRLVPYQALVSCQILNTNELYSIITIATLTDINLMNQMIRDCKIKSEGLVENAPLINVYHLIIGRKSLTYVKILPNDTPTSKINRQYKTVLTIPGGCLSLTNLTIPYTCLNNHSYVPLDSILSLYPSLQAVLKPLARAPHTNEFDFLHLVQIYRNASELPADMLLIDIEDLNEIQIISSNQLTLLEYHVKENHRFQQQLILLEKSLSSNDKRKHQECRTPSKSTNQFSVLSKQPDSNSQTLGRLVQQKRIRRQ